MKNSDLMITDTDLANAGAVVYWRTSGTVRYDDLAAAWDDAGFDIEELLSPQSPESALRRAMRRQREQRLLVRPLDESGSWALVDEHAEDGDLEYRTRLTVRINKIGRLEFSDDAHPSVPSILADYQRNLEFLDASDVSIWLVRLLHRRSDAISLRDTGGFYYLPPNAVEWYQRVRAVMASVSGHTLYRIPAVAVDDVVDAVLDGVIDEASKEIEALDKVLSESDLGARGLANRSEKALEVMRKVQRYEKLLGRSMNDITERLTDLSSALAAASMAAEADAQENVRLVG